MISWRSNKFKSIENLYPVHRHSASAFLHLHEIVEGLYFHSSLSVCLCVCVSVCLCVCVSGSFLVNKIPAERVHRFGRGFRYMAAYRTGSDPIEFGDLGSKVKVTVTENVCKNYEKNSPKIQI